MQDKNYKKLDYKKLNKVIALLGKLIVFLGTSSDLTILKNQIYPFILADGIKKGIADGQCIAGWLYIAKNCIKDKKLIEPKNLHRVSHENVIKMTNDMLGVDLQRWTWANAKLWDNDEGLWVFENKRAFTHKKKRPDGAKNLIEAVAHLKELSARLQIAEDRE